MPFDLRQSPLWRVHLCQLGDADHVWALLIHHIIADAWSLEVLQRELASSTRRTVRDGIIRCHPSFTNTEIMPPGSSVARQPRKLRPRVAIGRKSWLRHCLCCSCRRTSSIEWWAIRRSEPAGALGRGACRCATGFGGTTRRDTVHSLAGARQVVVVPLQRPDRLDHRHADRRP